MSSTDAPSKIVSIEGLSFTWNLELPPLLSIKQFSLRLGEKLFIKGPSGSGKTTFLGLVGGVLLPQEGTLSILGKDLTQLSGPARDRFRVDHIGFVFQLFNLLPYLSVQENILLPCRFSRTRRKRSGKMKLEAQHLLNGFGLESSLLSTAVTELSVGQQQRVAAARALIGSPELIVADEPTSALDTDNRENFLETLFNECDRKQISLLFVSHDSNLAPLFDRQISMDEIRRSQE